MTTSNSATETDAWRAFSERLFDQNKFAIKLGLESMRVAFEDEGDPQRSAPAVVVGGTNGKGGTSAALVAILQAHGLSTGFYSSPHLIEVRERFRVDGRPVSREVALRHGQAVLKKWGDPNSSEPCLTFFELTTLIASRIFAEADVDVAVWEVGLGGRLDAVNAIDPALTIVTSIGLDHQKYLGDTIEEIAGEKAALFRADVPALIGHQQHRDALRVLQAAAPHARLVEPDLVPGVDAVTQWNHALAAQAAAMVLERRGEPLNLELAANSLANLTWWGRRDERIVGGQRYLIDAAHNPQGAEGFYHWADMEGVGAVVFAAMSDKDLQGLLAGLSNTVTPVIHAHLASPRAATAAQVEEALGRPVEQSYSPAKALARARELAQGKAVAVFGSLYLLGDVYDALGFTADDFSVGDSCTN